MYAKTWLGKKIKTKLHELVWIALTEKVDILRDLGAITLKESVKVAAYMEEAILAEPDRDPYVILDQIARTYINKKYDN